MNFMDDDSDEEFVREERFRIPHMHIDLDDSPTQHVQNPLLANEVHTNTVSTLHKCVVEDMKYLCIYDIAQKLNHPDEYDIGGVYSGEPELWFYFTTSICPGYNYLLNLFVCHRKVGNCLLKISDNSQFTVTFADELSPRADLSEKLKAYTIRSAQPNQNHFIKTFCFKQTDLTSLKNTTLFIPATVQVNISSTLDPEVIKSIKLSQDFGNLLSDKEKTDFVIETASGKTYDVHKIILVAHSPVLKNAIKNSTKNSIFLDIKDEDIKLLLEFLYTGCIKDLLTLDCLTLLDIAERFGLSNLFKLVQYAIGKQIKVNNAVDIVLITEKYNLISLQNEVFNFIKNNPAVLETDGWMKLDNVQLTKKLFQYIYSAKKMD